MAHLPPRDASSARPSTSRSRRPTPSGLATAARLPDTLLTRGRSRWRGLARPALDCPGARLRLPRAQGPWAPPVRPGHPARLAWSFTPRPGCRSTPSARLETPPVSAPRPPDSPRPWGRSPRYAGHRVVRSLGRRSGSLPFPVRAEARSARGLESTRQSCDPDLHAPHLARAEARALPDPRRPFLQATRRPSRVAPPRRSAALRHARADSPVPPPRPPLASPSRGPKLTFRGGPPRPLLPATTRLQAEGRCHAET
jgi:hypothetical protein